MNEKEINYLLLLIHSDLKDNDSVFQDFITHEEALQLMLKLKNELV